jgi:hypothetical protein
MTSSAPPTWMHAALTSAWIVAQPWLECTDQNQHVPFARAYEAVLAAASAAALTVAQARLTGLTDMFVND